MTDPGEIAAFHDRCSDFMRELLDALAAAPDRPRPFPQIEDAMGWPRRRIASVLGGVSHLRHTEFGGRRPYRFLDDRVLIVVLGNLESPYVPAISRDLAAIVFGEPYSMPQARQAIALDPRLYEAYVGEYWFADDGRTHTMMIRREGDRLIAQIAGDPAFELLPLSELEFFVEAFDDRFTFGADPRGQAAYVVMDMAGRLVRANKIKG